MHDVVLVGLVTGGCTLAAGLFSQIVSHQATERREEKKRRLELVKAQVEDLYGPLIALIEEFNVVDSLHLSIDQLMYAQQKDAVNPEPISQTAEMNAYNSRQREQVLVPTLRKIAVLLRDKRWLADHATAIKIPGFIRHVEIIERQYQNSIVPGIAKRLNEDVVRIGAFHDHLKISLEEKLRILDGAADGQSWLRWWPHNITKTAPLALKLGVQDDGRQSNAGGLD